MRPAESFTLTSQSSAWGVTMVGLGPLTPVFERTRACTRDTRSSASTAESHETSLISIGRPDAVL